MSRSFSLWQWKVLPVLQMASSSAARHVRHHPFCNQTPLHCLLFHGVQHLRTGESQHDLIINAQFSEPSCRGWNFALPRIPSKHLGFNQNNVSKFQAAVVLHRIYGCMVSVNEHRPSVVYEQCIKSDVKERFCEAHSARRSVEDEPQGAVRENNAQPHVGGCSIPPSAALDAGALWSSGDDLQPEL